MTRRVLAAAVGGLALLGGVGPWTLLFLAALVVAALWPRARVASPPPDEGSSGWDAVIVTVAAISLGVRAALLPVGGLGLGVDWYSYLQNAWVMGNGQWEDYVRWRGPAHAWLVLGAAHVFGGLIAGSQWLAGACIMALVPLTWRLGTALAGRWVGLAAAVFLAAWPDFALFARFSTPYPLFALAMTLGTLGAVLAVQRGAAWALLAAVGMGLAIATDLRAVPYTAALAVSVALSAAFGVPVRRSLGAALVLAVGGLALGYAAMGQLPFELVPLGEQVALQRDLHAAEGRLECVVPGRQLPSLADFFGTCAQQTVLRNLARASACVGVGLPALAALVAVGWWPRRGARAWGALLALPAAAIVPSLFLVDVPHRYILPFAPWLAVLLVEGARRLCAGLPTPRWAGVATVTLLTSALIAQHLCSAAPMGRARTGRVAQGIAPPVVLGQVRPIDAAGELVRAQVQPGDYVLDCARGGLHLRLYPFPVEEARPPRPTVVASRCRRLLESGPDRPGVTWLLTGVPADVTIHPAWEARFYIPRPTERIQLLRATLDTTP